MTLKEFAVKALPDWQKLLDYAETCGSIIKLYDYTEPINMESGFCLYNKTRGITDPFFPLSCYKRRNFIAFTIRDGRYHDDLYGAIEGLKYRLQLLKQWANETGQ
jgi:hypothetical protein